MSELTVASRYAKSLIDLAQEQNLLEVFKTDMSLFLHTLKANPELKAVISNPIISHSKKKHILADIFTGKIDKATLSFFNLMIDKNRGAVLYTSAEAFIDQYDIKEHITKATIVSAAPLSEVNKKTIVTEVEAMTKGTVDLHTKVDPTLIGGFILTIGDRQLDTSISGTLKKLKKDFVKSAV